LTLNYRAKKDNSLRTNEQITASEVRVISSNGKQLGVISIREALYHAEDEGFDLVEVSPDAKPPVCKIIDYGKLKYKEQKSKKEAKKKQKTIEVKEIKMRPGIDKHDYEVKIKALSKFISGGNKVKVSLRFRGREMEHQNLGMELLKKLTEEVSEYAKIEIPPKSEGRQIMMVLVPQLNKQ
jgi:translation initiation factor IF-3